jgi:hypothetical protein
MSNGPQRYGIWDRDEQERAARDQCEERVDALIKLL